MPVDRTAIITGKLMKDWRTPWIRPDGLGVFAAYLMLKPAAKVTILLFFRHMGRGRRGSAAARTIARRRPLARRNALRRRPSRPSSLRQTGKPRGFKEFLGGNLAAEENAAAFDA